MADSLSLMSARAVIPDQLLDYVTAVSGPKSSACESCILHQWDDQAVLVAYPSHDPLDEEAMNAAIQAASRKKDIKKLTILSARVPQIATPDTISQRDQYWRIPLPPQEPKAKLRNILKRAARDISITARSGPDAWTPAHSALVENFLKRKKMDEGTTFLFGRMSEYLSNAHDAILFSGLLPDGSLGACAIGDFSALNAAFYMFAFRQQDAPPGSADLLLSSIIAEGIKRGHSFLNLGLGIDPGVEFFKRKWRAEPWLPYVETNLQLKRNSGGWFRRLFGH